MGTGRYRIARERVWTATLSTPKMYYDSKRHVVQHGMTQHEAEMFILAHREQVSPSLRLHLIPLP